MSFRRDSISALLTLACVAAMTACAPRAQPRTSHPLKWQEYSKLGGVVDASRGFPLAFYADPGAEPRIVDVDGTDLYAADWMTHLAKRMNQALAKVSLYDSRFMPVAQKLFSDKLINGAYTYPYRGAGKEMQTSALHARIAVLKFQSVAPVTVVAESGYKVVVEVKMFSMTRLYVHESTGSHWDKTCFEAIGRKILSDSAFWRAVQAAP